MSYDSQSIFLEMNEVEDFHNSNYLENKYSTLEYNSIPDNSNKYMNNIVNYDDSISYTDYETSCSDKIIQYNACTMKQLYLICEYYDILKSVQKSKLKKSLIIEQIIWFESQMQNKERVELRMKSWKAMELLSKDKTLSRFVVGWKYNTVEYNWNTHIL